MFSIRKTVICKTLFSALLAASTLSLAPSLAAAEEPARGKFTLTHDVHWGIADVPAGEYEFSFDPNGPSHVMMLNKFGRPRAGYMLLVSMTEGSGRSESNRLVLEATPDGSCVRAMELPEFGVTLHFDMPSHARPMAKAVTTAGASGQ